MIEHRSVRDFYAEPGPMTSAGEYAALIAALPKDVAELVRIIHGLGIYDVVASDFYGVQLSDERKVEIHIRRFEEMLDRLTAADHGSLEQARPPDKRLACRCRNFVLLLLAPLRAKDVPARARSGFSAYLNPGYYEDHWLCEYWNASEERWQLVDPQLDEVWRERLSVDLDPLDVPRDQFLVAADAWERCRGGDADAERFGISFTGLRGMWFVAGSLVRDLAALNKMEMLPWDVWGAQPRPDEQLDVDQLAIFDELAALTREPDATFAVLRKTYEENEHLRVPEAVFNALLERPESL